MAVVALPIGTSANTLSGHAGLYTLNADDDESVHSKREGSFNKEDNDRLATLMTFGAESPLAAFGIPDVTVIHSVVAATMVQYRYKYRLKKLLHIPEQEMTQKKGWYRSMGTNTGTSLGMVRTYRYLVWYVPYLLEKIWSTALKVPILPVL